MATVQTIVDAIKYRVNDTQFTGASGITSYVIPAINELLQVIDITLYQMKSDLARTALSVALEEDDASCSMPTEFIALSEKPWIDGETSTLNPIPDRKTALSLSTTSSTPMYYELIGSTLKLYPPTGEAGTLKGYYFAFSTAMSSASSTIPFGGIFDLLIKEYLVKMYQMANTARDEAGQMRVMLDPMFAERLKSEVTLIVRMRDGNASAGFSA